MIHSSVLAALGLQQVFWIGLILALWLFRLAYVIGSRRFGASERRARLLDELAATVRYGLPLQPVFAHARRGAPIGERRALHRIAMDLEEGASLAESVTLPRRNVLPAHVLGPLRAAEGTAAIDVVLEAAARTEERRVTVLHRVLLALLYPFGIAVLCIPMAVLGKFTEIVDSMEVTPPAWWATGFEAGSTLATVAGALGGVVILTLLGRSALDAIPRLCPTSNGPVRGLRAWLPYFGRITSLGSGARTLRALSALLRAGKPLHDALRGAAPAADAARFERRFVAVAGRLEQGDAIAAAWHDAPLPPSVRERAVLASRGPSAEAARSFETLADDLDLRHGAAVDGFIARLQPAALLFVGVTVLLQAMVVFSFITFMRDAVKPW